MVCEMRNAQQGCGFGIFSDSSLKSLSAMNFAPRGNNNWNNSDNYGGGYGNGSGAPRHSRDPVLGYHHTGHMPRTGHAETVTCGMTSFSDVTDATLTSSQLGIVTESLAAREGGTFGRKENPRHRAPF